MNPFFQKVITTALAIVCAIASAYIPDPAGSWLYGLAGILIGAVWVRRPGDAPGGDGSAAALGLVLLLGASGCGGAFGRVVWPAVTECGVPDPGAVDRVWGLAKQEAANGRGLSADGKRQLGRLGLEYGAGVITCALRTALAQRAAVGMFSGTVALEPEHAGAVDSLQEMIDTVGGAAIR